MTISFRKMGHVAIARSSLTLREIESLMLVQGYAPDEVRVALDGIVRLREALGPLQFWDEELAELDAKATAIFGEAVVLAAIGGLRPPPGVEMTLARILEYQKVLKAELRRLVRPQ
jgi:hypothetical protein